MTDQTAHQPPTDQQLDDARAEIAKLVRWHREDGAEMDKQRATIGRLRTELADQRAYEKRLREQHDLDVAELNRLRSRVAELERPAIEAKRNEIRSSYVELISQAEQDRDYEGAFDVQCRLRDREEQWKREDAPAPVAAVVSSADGTPGSAR